MSQLPPEYTPPSFQPPEEPPPVPGQRFPLWIVITGGVLALLLVVGVFGFAFARMNSDDPEATPSAPNPSITPTPSESPSTPPTALPATDPKLAKFYDQKLAWTECGSGQCAFLTVPLDYSKPDDATIKLAVLKIPADDQTARVGSLVVNPGGPGGSGVQYAAAGALQFGGTLTKYFDLVGFDPRGVGSSTPLKCVTTKQADALVASDPDPDTQAERDEMDRLIRDFGQGCLDKSGDLARHMSTVEAAKDIDILRAALGEAKLDYFGASYGTFLGGTYAQLFPTRVRRMVLDGAIDPSLSNEQLSLVQANGFEVALRAYVKDCIDQGDCVLGDTVDQGTKRIRAFLDATEKKSLPTDTDRQLTAGTAMLGIWMPLYVKSYWRQLTSGLEQALKGRGSKLLSLADLYASRGPKEYSDNSLEALYAVNCLDHDDYIPTSQVVAKVPEFEKASPTFGKAFAFSLSTCSAWPIKSGNKTTALTAEGAPPIVVVGTTRDPATPLVWAQALAKQLDSGTLITRDGDGHTGFQQGNACVDSAIEAYLVQGKVPPADLKC